MDNRYRYAIRICSISFLIYIATYPVGAVFFWLKHLHYARFEGTSYVGTGIHPSAPIGAILLFIIIGCIAISIGSAAITSLSINRLIILMWRRIGSLCVIIVSATYLFFSLPNLARMFFKDEKAIDWANILKLNFSEYVILLAQFVLVLTVPIIAFSGMIAIVHIISPNWLEEQLDW